MPIFARLSLSSKIFFGLITVLIVFHFSSCKKDKLTTDPGARVHFSQDSVLFDTVFTSIGSSTRNIRVVNNNKQKINISEIRLKGGNASPFIINVDGAPGKSFQDVEIAANDSMYIFIQVYVNPNNQNSPLIISDELQFTVNGNLQSVYLEAWGQDAYYHYPNKAIKFKDGSYLAYSLVAAGENTTVVWTNDKPHVIYGYLVVDSTQSLIMQAGTRVFLNYKAGIWVYRYGNIQVLGQKGNEVTFQGARREKDWADEPGQWDRIWINEGSKNNIIDFAIIKNGFIGVQAEFFGGAGVNFITEPRRLRLTNTQIKNMSLWGLYCLGYNVYAGNNVISNCFEHNVNILLGGNYNFIHCTFANFWEKDKTRDKTIININNHTATQVIPLDTCNFANCIVDGKLANELSFDLNHDDVNFPPKYLFSNCWIKTNSNISDPNHFQFIRTGEGISFESIGAYNFTPKSNETQVKNFVNAQATVNAQKFPNDINNSPRNTTSVTVGAYEVN